MCKWGVGFDDGIGTGTCAAGELGLGVWLAVGLAEDVGVSGRAASRGVVWCRWEMGQ